MLGGTSLAGGTGSVLATAVGALFLTQLQQVLTANGAAQSIEYIIQGSIVALGMLLRTCRGGAGRSRASPPPSAGPRASPVRPAAGAVAGGPDS